MYDSLVSKEKKLAVIGLGYVGLPIALAFSKKLKVIGFDISTKKIELLKKSIDPSKEIESKEFENCDIQFTDNLDVLKEANFFIVAVPTPIDTYKRPDLFPLISATQTVAKVLKKGDYVVFESTVYPGCTEEDCLPVLEKISGLQFQKDFMLGYSPERINPGDKQHTLQNVIKVVSGCCDFSLDQIAKVYELVVDVGVHRAPSIKVAEAAKIIENTQRDVNIALMNELSLIFDKLNINTSDVLEAAGTKWNFLKFYPGLVGGHCIGVDPYYLTYKASQLGIHAKVINSGREINDDMGEHVAQTLVKKLVSKGKEPTTARALIIGATFKENVTDIRNSKVYDVYHELNSFGVKVDIIDALADKDEVLHEYKIHLLNAPNGKYDIVIVAVSHDAYKSFDEKYFETLLTDIGVLADLKSLYRGKIVSLDYWSL
jgi:UDP-N-acetyl-D-glucosamine/UDP-N-acetyl-D-galactosamine dehydrogenase